MFLFSTVIYFGDNPVGYDVYRQDKIFRFMPAVGSKGNSEPVQLAAVYSEGLWAIEGTNEIEIIEQVRKIVGLNELISFLNVAS